MIDNRTYHLQQPTVPVNSSTHKFLHHSTNQVKDTNAPFTQILAHELSGVQFSQHALQRLQTRNIKLGPTELIKLNDAVRKAAQKGAKESLVIMNNSNLALVVSVKNKTVITAMDGTSLKDNIFTNIDSAVII